MSEKLGARTERWPASRRLLATLAVLLALLTTSGTLAVAEDPVSAGRAIAYLGLTAIALLYPTALVVQIVAGLVLCSAAMPSGGGLDTIAVVPILAGVIATAEVVAVVHRLEPPFHRDITADLGRVVLAASIGGTASGTVVLFTEVPGPTGIAATGLAAAGCLLLAVALLRSA